MKARVIIKRKSVKDVETKYGTKQMYSFLLATPRGETWASAFSSPMSDQWKEGDDLELEVVQNGKFWNIVVPKADAAESPLLQTLKRIEGKIDQLLSGPVDAPGERPFIDEVPKSEPEDCPF